MFPISSFDFPLLVRFDYEPQVEQVDRCSSQNIDIWPSFQKASKSEIIFF